MNVKESVPKMVYPYPAQASSTMSTTSASLVTSMSNIQMKQQELQQVLQKQQTSTTVRTTASGSTEPVLSTPGFSSTTISSPDKQSIKGAAVGQYCGILLQPGMVPHVQLASAGPRPTNAAAGNSQSEQYSNLFTLQGIPYGSTVANPTVLGMAPSTVIPYFLGITQAGATPKPIVPATTSTTMAKESSPTSSTSTTPVSTSAIAAAYRAFVSIAPASVTNCSFSQQLVNLVSNYNNPYWQQLLTQGASSQTLAYQLMQINQYAGTTSGLPTQTSKSSSVKNVVSSHGQTKATAPQFQIAWN